MRAPGRPGRGGFAAAATLAVALAAVAFQLPVFDRSMSFLDEGHLLQFADIVHRGGELYRDASSIALPGAFYLLALAFDLFGPSIAVARWIVVLEFTAFAVMIHLLLRRMAAPAVAWLGVASLFLYKLWVFPHWLMYSYSTTAQCLLAGALLLVVRHLDAPSRRDLGAAGLLTGLAVLCKQDYGGAAWIALNAALLLSARGRPRPQRPGLAAALTAYNAPVVAVGILTALHFLRQGLLGEMLQQTLVNHWIGIASGAYSSLPPLWPLFEQTPLFRGPYGISAYAPAILFTLDWDLLTGSAFYRKTFLWDACLKLFFYAPYLIAAFGAARAWRGRAALRDAARRPDYLRETALLLFAAASILALNKPVDFVHVGVLYWPFPLLTLLWLGAALRGRPRAARAVALL
ncbi:MAG TPA: glycosyltransferase family 39 protein, partial [Myxococcota bacterium]